MAPTPAIVMPSGEQLHRILRSISSLGPRSVSQYSSPLTSLFATLDRQASSISSRAGLSIAYSIENLPRESVASSLSLSRRQNNGGAILAIPTTYVGLNAGPAPGIVVAIILGSVGGFLVCLWVLYTMLRLSGRFSTGTVIEEEIIRRRSRSPRRSRSRSETIEIRSEPQSPPPRRTSRRETIVVEETISRPEPPPDDDIVEVIEEHSPERRPSRRKSDRVSGAYRTVDPAEFGGGDAPRRKISRR